MSVCSDGLPPSRASKCKVCGGELAAVDYVVPGFVWGGLALFPLSVLTFLYPLLADIEIQRSVYMTFITAGMALEILSMLMIAIGFHRVRKCILAGLSDASRGK